MPSVTNRSGCKRGVSRYSLQLFHGFLGTTNIIALLTSGLSSTVISDTVGSIFGGSGIWIEYSDRIDSDPHPLFDIRRRDSLPNPTTNFAICLTLMTYLLEAAAAAPEAEVVAIRN
jgi:hypothetical protein